MSKKALVVDNDFFFVEFLTEILEKRGYEVLKAYDGKEGISKLEEGPVDLLLSDVVMPKIDGKQFIQYIRKKHPDLNIPIIAVSGVLMEQMDQIGEIGADYYLAKGPMEQMEQSVNNFLDKLEIKPFPSPSDEIFFQPSELLPRPTTVELIDNMNFQQAITESIGVGILVIDRDARIINTNALALELLNKPLEDVLNCQVTTLFSGKERAELIRALKKIIQNRELKKVSFSVNCHTGEIRIIVTLLKINNEIAGWIMAMEDIDQWDEQA